VNNTCREEGFFCSHKFAQVCTNSQKLKEIRTDCRQLPSASEKRELAYENEARTIKFTPSSNIKMIRTFQNGDGKLRAQKRTTADVKHR